MVQEIVCKIIADVAEYAAAVDCDSGVPVVEEYKVGEVPEGGGEYEKEGWRHYESVTVHG